MAREGCVEDLARCYALHESCRLPYDEACRRALAEMWRALLSNGSMLLSLVENRAKPIGLQIVSFAATILVSDEFCCEARSLRPPYLGVEITRCYLSRELPVLSREQVARANAQDGLNVLMCFGGSENAGMSREQILAVREKQFEAFYLVHSGYRVKELLGWDWPSSITGDARFWRSSQARLFALLWKTWGADSKDFTAAVACGTDERRSLR